jgi:hypothetical protein
LTFQININGLTGRIEFKEGKRDNFKLDLLKLKREELRKVGHWTPAEGINITDRSAFYETSTNNVTLIVMTREVRLTHQTADGVLEMGEPSLVQRVHVGTVDDARKLNLEIHYHHVR